MSLPTMNSPSPLMLVFGPAPVGAAGPGGAGVGSATAMAVDAPQLTTASAAAAAIDVFELMASKFSSSSYVRGAMSGRENSAGRGPLRPTPRRRLCDGSVLRCEDAADEADEL